MTESALRNVNRSFEEAAQNLGCTRWQRLRQDHAAAGVPGHQLRRDPVLRAVDRRLRHAVDHRARLPHLVHAGLQPVHLRDGRPPTMAVSISMLMIVISMLAVLLQRHLIGKRRYAGAMTNLPHPGRCRAPTRPRCTRCATPCRAGHAADRRGDLHVVPADQGAGVQRRLRPEQLRAGHPEVPDVITTPSAFAAGHLLITLAGGLISYIIVRRETRCRACSTRY
jgi:iron(III) transport system permease protein